MLPEFTEDWLQMVNMALQCWTKNEDVIQEN